MKKSKTVVLTVFLIIVLLIASTALFLNQLADRENAPVQPPNDTEQTGDTGSDQPQKPDENDTPADAQARIREIDAILNDPYMVLVNVDNGLTAEYEPAELSTLQDMRLEKKTAEQLELMLDAADEAGLDTINIYSAYRNYTRQQTNYNNKVDYYLGEGYSEDRARELAAEIVNPPGKSEHQTGLATDICTAEIVNTYGNLNEAFENTDEYTWLYEHCAEYGFILRYPKDKVEITGITFEPWHYRYVGVERAKEIMKDKLCLEEYIKNLKDEKAQLEQK